MSGTLEITQVKSIAKANKNQIKNIAALGLRHREHTVTHSDTPIIRGMINKVSHLVKVTER